MLSSVELPIAYLQYHYLFPYDFVIGSTCLEHPEYLEFYKKVSQEQDRLMILDNGAFETGEAIDDDKYIALVKELQPDIVVVPDVFQDNAATGSRAINFLTKWYADEDDWKTKISLMGVLQGSTPSQIHGLINTVYKDKVQYYGFGYGTGLDRFQFLSTHPEIKNVHILGLQTLPEAISLSQLPNVVSIDTSLPVKATLEHAYLGEMLSATQTAYPNSTGISIPLMIRNIIALTEACSGIFPKKLGEALDIADHISDYLLPKEVK